MPGSSGARLVFFCSCLPLLMAGCAPYFPQRSIDLRPSATREAAFRIPVFKAGAGDALPAVASNLGEITVHSCQFWDVGPFDNSVTEDDAKKRLQLEALKHGADGIIDVRYEPDKGNIWDQRCWHSIAAHGFAVKLAAGSPVPAVAATPAVAAAVVPAPIPAVTAAAAPAQIVSSSSTITAAGVGRKELLQWIQRLDLPRSNFIGRGPGGGNVDLIDEAAEIGAWSVQLARSGAAAVAGTVTSSAGVALVPGFSQLTMTSRQLGYDFTASWTYSAAGSWDVSGQSLKKLP